MLLPLLLLLSIIRQEEGGHLTQGIASSCQDMFLYREYIYL